MNVNDMDKKALRAACDAHSIPWNKQLDDEASLCKKLQAKLDEIDAEDGESSSSGEDEEVSEPKEDKSVKSEWNLKQRADTEELDDKKTGKKRIRPVDCFGWLHEKDNNECIICSHAKPCAKLTADADLSDFDDINKKPDPSEVRHAVDDELVETAPPVAKKSKKQKALSESTRVTISFDKAALKEVNPDLKPFYKYVLNKYGDKQVSVKKLVNVFEKYFEVEDRAAIVTDLIGTMVENKELTEV